MAAPLALFAQQKPAKVFRIGFLGVDSASSRAHFVEALRGGLRDLGYEEGRNMVFEFRWADGRYDRLRELAAELVRARVDLLVTYGTPGTLAAKQTTTIPIVMAVSGDAVGTGLIASLSQPGGNITGSTLFLPELMVKRLELLREVRPRAKRIAVIVNSKDPSRVPVLKAMEGASSSVKIELRKFEVQTPNDFESIFSAIAKGRAETVVVQEDTLLVANAKELARLAVSYKVPLAGSALFAEAGSLLGYGADTVQLHRRAAYFVDRILKGAKPGDLPVELPTRFELVINMKTAKALGLTIPQSVLVRADRVIE